MSELADEADSKSVDGNIVRVQVPPPAANQHDGFDTKPSCFFCAVISIIVQNIELSVWLGMVCGIFLATKQLRNSKKLKPEQRDRAVENPPLLPPLSEQHEEQPEG